MGAVGVRGVEKGLSIREDSNFCPGRVDQSNYLECLLNGAAGVAAIRLFQDQDISIPKIVGQIKRFNIGMNEQWIASYPLISPTAPVNLPLQVRAASRRDVISRQRSFRLPEENVVPGSRGFVESVQRQLLIRPPAYGFPAQQFRDRDFILLRSFLLSRLMATEGFVSTATGSLWRESGRS